MKKFKKEFLSLFVIVVFCFFAAGSTDSDNVKEGSNEEIKEDVKDNEREQGNNDNTVPKEVSENESNEENIQEEVSVEYMEINVESQIVKKVDKKYRYFFDVRNNDKKEFDGEATIKLYNDELKSPLGSETFKTTNTISPKLGTSVYLDINTGPTSEHGEYGITKFEYEIKVEGKVVKTGNGKISEKYEDLSVYNF